MSPMDLRALRSLHFVLIFVALRVQLAFFQLSLLHAPNLAYEDGVRAQIFGGKLLFASSAKTSTNMDYVCTLT